MDKHRKPLEVCSRSVEVSLSYLAFLSFPVSVLMSSSGSASASGRKKVDPRIRALIENGIQLHHRSLFVIVGDHGRDQASPISPSLRNFSNSFYHN